VNDKKCVLVVIGDAWEGQGGDFKGEVGEDKCRIADGFKDSGLEFRTFSSELTIGIPIKTGSDERGIGSGEDEKVGNVLNVKLR